MDLESTLQWVILKIDKNQKTIDEFGNDTLYMNIYYFYCFSQIYLLIVNGKKKL